jgi:hypothetical protein
VFLFKKEKAEKNEDYLSPTRRLARGAEDAKPEWITAGRTAVIRMASSLAG